MRNAALAYPGIKPAKQSAVIPAKAGIQYAAASRFTTPALEYWIIRWSLSSGGALRRPVGG
jgi:hypothetical protein